MTGIKRLGPRMVLRLWLLGVTYPVSLLAESDGE
jgi:hypothetical protein